MLKAYIYFLSAASLITALIFAWDKRLSRREENRRIPEIVLLSFIAAGGSVGGLFGMYVLRHKTDFSTKFHFGIGVWLCFALQAAVAVFLILFENGVISL